MSTRFGRARRAIARATTTIPAKRPVVKIEQGDDDMLILVCKVDGCDFTSDRHVVKASAEEYARYHRDQHRAAYAASQP